MTSSNQQIQHTVEFYIYSLESVLSERESEDNNTIDAAIKVLQRAKQEIAPSRKSELVSEAYDLLEEAPDEDEIPAWAARITSLDLYGDAELDYEKIAGSKYFIQIRRPMQFDTLYVASPFNDPHELSALIDNAQIPASHHSAVLSAFDAVAGGEKVRRGSFLIYDEQMQSTYLRSAGFRVIGGLTGLALGFFIGEHLPDAARYVAFALAQQDYVQAASFLYDAAELMEFSVGSISYGQIGISLLGIIGGAKIGNAAAPIDSS